MSEPLNVMKNPKINVMIEEYIYHFHTGLSFSFFLSILLLLSPGYIGTLPLPEKRIEPVVG